MLEKLKQILETVNPPMYIAKKAKRKEDIGGHIVSYVDRNSYVAEQYRVLRTSLYSLSIDKPIKSLAVTSSQSGEGKSTTCCNLAITLSLDPEKKTVLVDSDLRKPEIHRYLKLPRQPGLSDILIDKADFKEIVKKPVLDRLYVIPSGSVVANPAEMLRCTRLKRLISELKEQFDYIIFDTPPTLNVTDSSVIGSLCDSVILVVKAEVTQKAMIEEAFSLLKNAQAAPIGCVLTNFRVPPYYAYKYKRYYKYK
ncbi:MAG: CpsD/CapB family tyrosine-protein kinase [Omnitrophica bacterium]|nr:CpsD/CapB family tyrosine-protein kinase [Candidatus Omnitrophota bacterium]